MVIQAFFVYDMDTRRTTSRIENMEVYRIQVKESPGHHIDDYFPGLTITTLENGEAMLTASLVDQAALRGLLNHLWDFNISVTAVERIK
jgi:hypothetical protein